MENPTPVVTPWFSLTPGDRQSARAWLDARGIGEEFIVLAPGAAWATKRWPGFARLAASLTQPIVVIGGSEDRTTGEAIAEVAPGRAHNGAGDFTLVQSAAIISHSGLVVCNDSIALHLAVALARPVVAVVGPTGPAPGFAPIPPTGSIVAHPDLACRPCSSHGQTRCPLGHHRCMQELEVEVVRAAVTRSF
jgi:heptosyltransferase-2